MKLLAATLLAGTAASPSIKTDSEVGEWLLSKARRLDGGGGGGRRGDMSWAWSYSIRFERCASSKHPWSEEYYHRGSSYGGNGEYNQYLNGNRYGLYEQRLVHFKLCPKDHCDDNCAEGGDYVVDMYEFLDAYMEYRQDHLCSNVASHCYCENAYDDQACVTECYMSAGIYDLCADEGNVGGQGFSLGEVGHCQALGIDEEAVQYDNQEQKENAAVSFFVGPHCSADGKSIYLKIFSDERCSFSAPEGIYEATHYGNVLPYSNKSIVEKDCISCDNKSYEASETCQRLYEESGKCESNMKDTGRYHNTLACDFIKGLSDDVAGALENVMPYLAGTFAVSTLLFGGLAHLMNQRVQRNKVALLHGEGERPQRRKIRASKYRCVLL
ncbi:hypothetical protein ACHAWF_009587 [Thalassiosira exigua]